MDKLDPDMPAQELRLHMGELTAEEVRVARAAIAWANARRAPLEKLDSEDLICDVANAIATYIWSDADGNVADFKSYECAKAALAAVREKLNG